MDSEDSFVLKATATFTVLYLHMSIPGFSEKKKPSPLLSSALIPPSFPSAPVLSHSPLKLRQPTGATKH